MEEFKCKSYSLAMEIFEKLYSIHPDTAVLSKSAYELKLSFSADGMTIEIVYLRQMAEFEIEFIASSSRLSSSDYHVMCVLLDQFRSIYNEKIKEAENDLHVR